MNRIHHYLCRSDSWRTTVETKLVPWTIAGTQLGRNLLEIGPGPGLTTAVLRRQVESLTAIEIDPKLAKGLRARSDWENVTVVEGDATRLPFPDGTFSSAAAFTMLHHVPSAELQDRLFAEAFRVLEPGGVFLGTDSRTSWQMRLLHLFDIMVCIDPASLGARLERSGFRDVEIESEGRRFRFRAAKA